MSIKSLNRVDFIVIHCTATPPSFDIHIDDIDAMHKERGFDMVGYHRLVTRDEAVEMGRPDNLRGAHVKGHNWHSLGLAIAGGVDEDGKPENNFTDDQMICLENLVGYYSRKFQSAKVVGHRDMFPDLNGDGVVDKTDWLKECPCFDVREWWKGCG